MNLEILTKQLGDLLEEVKTLNNEKAFLISKCNYWEQRFNQSEGFLNKIRYKIENTLPKQ